MHLYVYLQAVILYNKNHQIRKKMVYNLLLALSEIVNNNNSVPRSIQVSLNLLARVIINDRIAVNFIFTTEHVCNSNAACTNPSNQII